MRARHHCYRFGAGFSLPSSATLIIKLTHSIFLLIFFRFPCNFAIEVSPLFQTAPVSTKKITVEGMGGFFSISKRKTEKKGKGERNM